ITGATGAIGKAIAMNLASFDNYKIILIARNQNKAEKTVNEIINTTGNNAVEYRITDLSSFESIKALSEEWKGPMHILINNAAESPRQKRLTAKGIEVQFATNVLGYFWMMQEMTKHLRNSAPSRIINVASYWAGGLNLTDPEFIKRSYDNDKAYRQSKQANRMLTIAFADKLRSFNIYVNACHPGDVNSKLSNDLGFGGHETANQGAATPVWLATNPIGIESTGKYYEHLQESRCQFASNKHEVIALYELCESYSK
ncbi:SDR family NAD(P)-dependent oxidoreductase, partial [candidate division KSB1 bacterium]